MVRLAIQRFTKPNTSDISKRAFLARFIDVDPATLRAFPVRPAITRNENEFLRMSRAAVSVLGALLGFTDATH